MNIRALYRKLYFILILSASLTLSLLYVLLSGRTTKQNKDYNKETIVTPPTTSSTPSTVPTILPTVTPESVIYDTTSNDSFLRIVNKEQRIESDYVPSDLVNPNVAQNDNQKLRLEAAKALENMFQEASDSGISLYLVSGYRSYSDQVDLQSYYQNLFGLTEAARIDCIPGASEHQLGLAVDLGTTDHLYELNTNFSNTDAYQWLIQNCARFGFILRYPNGKEEVTGIKYSPWNFRYVGIEFAQNIMNSNLTMEEYFSAN